MKLRTPSPGTRRLRIRRCVDGGLRCASDAADVVSAHIEEGALVLTGEDAGRVQLKKDRICEDDEVEDDAHVATRGRMCANEERSIMF